MELRRDSPLFDKVLPIEVLDDQDDPHYVTLVFRIIKGYRNTSVPGQTEVIYHFEISDDRDSYFLFHLDVGEQDYPHFKREHAIRVEFHSMPTKIIELLEQCIASSSTTTSGDNTASALNEDTSIFSAKLNSMTGVFSIILSNHFNNVLTLNLQMIAGDDSAIKSYLAARMNLSLESNRRQGMEIAMLKSQNEENENEIEKLKIHVHELRTQKSVDIQSLRAEHSQEVSQMQRVALENLEENRAKFEEIISKLKLQLEETQRELHSRTMFTQQQIADLEHENGKLDFKTRDLTRLLASTESDRDRLLKETEDLHATRRTLEEERALLLRDFTRLESRNEALLTQIKDREESMLKSQQLQKASEDAKQTAEERTKLFVQRNEEILSTLNLKIDELQVTQSKLQHVTSELSNLKKSLFDKNEVIRQQESLIQEQKKQNNDLKHHISKLEDEKHRLTDSFDRCKRDLQEAKVKLEESTSVLESNRNVIEYLNHELSRNQLGDRIIAEPAAAHPRTPATAYGSSSAKTPETAVGRFVPFSSAAYSGPATADGGYSNPFTPSSLPRQPQSRATGGTKGRNLLQDPALSPTEDQLLIDKGIHALGLVGDLQDDLGLNVRQMTAVSSSAASSLSLGDGGNRIWRNSSAKKSGVRVGVELEEMDYYATAAAAAAATTATLGGSKTTTTSMTMAARAGGGER